ncbi:MAG TPA: family 16 glycoside hydrolase [Gemmataceae bacterium]|nr:family 16 glycoside hydrolase [Gemmataceae bacterium]
MHRLRWLLAGVLLLGLGSGSGAGTKAGWITLFNGKDTGGWKLRQEKITVTKFLDASGKEIPGAKKKGKLIVDKKGNEIEGAKAVQETIINPSGWVAENDELRCVKPHGGNDILTDQKFTDFELHIEFQATSNSGVYLQGRYEIQVNNDYNTKPKIVEKDGKKTEVWDTHQCGAIYGRIAPSKNMSKPPKEWQSFDVVFHGARGEKGKVTKKARVTLVWNGEKVIDNAVIDGVTGAALDGKVTEPGPLLLQGDHGKVAFRNIKIRPLVSAKSTRSVRADPSESPANKAKDEDEKPARTGKQLKVPAQVAGGPNSMAIRSAREAARFTGKNEDEATAELAKRLKVNAIDWRKQMVIVISGGVQRTGGYSVQVNKLAVKDNVLTVHWKLNAPKPGDFVTQALTRPGLTVLTERFDGEVRFDPPPPKAKLGR